MPRKTKTVKSKPKPPFAALKPKKGFAAVQIVVAVCRNGNVGVFHFEAENPGEAIDSARYAAGEGRHGDYKTREAESATAEIHLVELMLPIPKPLVVKKAKARAKKIAGPKAETAE